MPRATLYIAIAIVVIFLARLLFIRMRGAFVYDELVTHYGRRRVWFWMALGVIIFLVIRLLLRRL